MSERDPDPAWEAATPEGLRRVQLRDQARLPVGSKLDWLDDAQEFVATIERNRRERARRAGEVRDERTPEGGGEAE